MAYSASRASAFESQRRRLNQNEEGFPIFCRIWRGCNFARDPEQKTNRIPLVLFDADARVSDLTDLCNQAHCYKKDVMEKK